MSQIPELFLNEDFILEEFAPHIPFCMAYNVHLVCKAWSKLVDISAYTKSVTSSSPNPQELEEYKKYGGSLKFNIQVKLTILRSRYHLVENFMTEEEFECLCYEGIFGVYKASKLDEFNKISSRAYYDERSVILATKYALNLFESCNKAERIIAFTDTVLFFLMTGHGSKFIEKNKNFKKSVIGKEDQLKTTIFWYPTMEERFAILKEFD